MRSRTSVTRLWKMEALFDLLADEAELRGLRFLVIGGRGLVAHGIQRFTRDIDIAIGEAALPDLRRFMQNAGYTAAQPIGQFARFRGQDDSAPPLDVMTVSDATFEKMWGSAIAGHLGRAGLRAPDLATFIAMKLLSLRNQPDRAFKDAGDLDALVRAARGSLTGENLRALCTRYGTPDEASRLLSILEA